ncbi:MAG: hypothetical protein HOV87_06760 [Catenulispora sp.]|nr:hypothetical protein [Catenulispora sp.]
MIPSPYPPYPTPATRPRTRSQRVMRVAWASFPVWSAGTLCWVPALRLAIGRNTPRAWALCVAIAVGTVAGFWIDIATSQTKADKTLVSTWPGVLCILTLMIAPTVHYCLATRVGQTVVETGQTDQTDQTAVSPEDVQAGLRELRGIIGRREQW